VDFVLFYEFPEESHESVLLSLELKVSLQVIVFDSSVESADAVQHLEQFLLALRREEVLLVVVLEGNAVGDLEHSLAESAEELGLHEGGRLLLGYLRHEVGKLLRVLSCERSVSVALVGGVVERGLEALGAVEVGAFELPPVLLLPRKS
jgi:hypothetical protein